MGSVVVRTEIPRREGGERRRCPGAGRQESWRRNGAAHRTPPGSERGAGQHGGHAGTWESQSSPGHDVPEEEEYRVTKSPGADVRLPAVREPQTGHTWRKPARDSHRQRHVQRCERGGWQSSWSRVPRVCTPHADGEGGEPRPTGPTGGKATPGSTAVGGNDRRDLELTHGLNATAPDGGAGTAPSGDAGHDAGAPERRGQAAGGLSPDAPGWRAGGGRGQSGGVRCRP